MKICSCYDCIYLDKSRKEKSENGTDSFRYGCNSETKNCFICGWILKDNELKTMGCSRSNKIRVGTIFLLDGTNCLYCGSLNNGKTKRYLVYNASTYVSNGYCVDSVEQNWILKNLKKIKFLKQTEEQFNGNKKRAKFYKRRFIEMEKENNILWR